MNVNVLFFLVLYISIILCVCAIILLCVALIELHRKHVEKKLKKIMLDDAMCKKIKLTIKDDTNSYMHLSRLVKARYVNAYIRSKELRSKYSTPPVQRVRGFHYKKRDREIS